MSSKHLEFLRENTHLGYASAAKVLGLSRQRVHQLCVKFNIEMTNCGKPGVKKKLHRGPGRTRDATPPKVLEGVERNKPYLYVIAEVEKGPCKIGITDHVTGRLETLQLGNHRELKCFFSERIAETRRVSRMVETKIHNSLSARLIRREWFDCTVEEAKKAIKFSKCL